MKYLVGLIAFFFISCSNNVQNININDYQKKEKKHLSQSQKKEKKVKFESNIEKKVIKQEEIKKVEVKKKKIIKKIAFIYPSKTLGKYAKNLIDSMGLYLLNLQIEFEFKSFDIETFNNIDKIYNIFDEALKDDFRDIIVLVDIRNYNYILNYKDIDKLNIFFPLIQKQLNSPKNIFFGAISYKKQLDKIYSLINSDKVIFFVDKTILGQKISKLANNYNPIKVRNIESINYRFQKYFGRFKKLFEKRYIILGAKLINNAILLSQLRANEVYPIKIFSTQVSYTPLLFNLTQKEDISNLLIANSIGKIDDNFIALNELFNIDIEYNWVNYSTLVGIDYFFTKNSSNIFENKIIDNKIDYDVKIIGIKDFTFRKLSE